MLHKCPAVISNHDLKYLQSGQNPNIWMKYSSQNSSTLHPIQTVYWSFLFAQHTKYFFLLMLQFYLDNFSRFRQRKECFPGKFDHKWRLYYPDHQRVGWNHGIRLDLTMVHRIHSVLHWPRSIPPPSVRGFLICWKQGIWVIYDSLYESLISFLIQC